MAKAKAWEVTDEFWSRVEPLIPVRQRVADQTYTRKSGGGRKPKDPRLVFEGIVLFCAQAASGRRFPLSAYGSASAIHARFLEWEKAGVFEALWKRGLAEYDEFEGIAWRWQSIDGAMMKAPLAQKRGTQSNGSGKKMGASAICWWTVVASRCRSS
jgi:transposase